MKERQTDEETKRRGKAVEATKREKNEDERMVEGEKMKEKD
jgi:hypothetical protein